MQHRTSLSVQGLRVIIINDKENVFYPILYMNVERFKLVLDNKLDEPTVEGARPKSHMDGETDVRLMISYYNNEIEFWEPFVERTNIRLSIEKNAAEMLTYVCFRSPLKVNLTEELIENIMQAYIHLLQHKK